MIWSCPRLAHYWAGVQKILHDIAPLNNDDSPEHCLLGLRVKSTNSDPVRKFMNLALILAKRNITMKWKATKPPSIVDWHKEMVRWGRAEGAEL